MSLLRNYVFIPGSHPMTGAGLPHSETSGSKCACHSPELIAACRVLHRLVMPRHPSCARIRLAEDSKTSSNLVTLQFLIPRLCSCQRSTPPEGGEILSDAPKRAVPQGGLVGVPGIEPGTSSLSGTRSNQLSYTPARAPTAKMVEAAGFEPAASSLQSWRSTN